MIKNVFRSKILRCEGKGPFLISPFSFGLNIKRFRSLIFGDMQSVAPYVQNDLSTDWDAMYRDLGM
jgi:hypothetical protein